MTLQQLVYFQTIGSTGNFRRAAEILHVSQPCLSSAISRLEQELDVYLFERRGRHVELTKLGKYYLGRVDHALKDLTQATDDLRRLANATYGRVDVAFCGPLTRELVPHLIRDFLSIEQNSKITFDITQMTTIEIIKAMKEDERFDVAFCTQVKNQEGLTFIPISVQELVAIVPTDHPLAHQESVFLQELICYPLISYILHSGIYNLIMDWLHSYHLEPQIAYTAHDELSIAALVSTGFGVGIVADIPALRQHDLKRLKISNPNACFDISMVFPPNQYTTPAVNRFLRFAKERLALDPALRKSET